MACARWHRGQCAMWMGGTDIWGRPPPRPHTAQRGVAQCVRTAGSAEPAASRPRMVIGGGAGRPLRPHTAQRGVAQCVRTAGSAEPAASRPRMVIGWGQTTQTPHSPEGGGAVRTHCRLSRASRQQTPYGNGVGCGCGHVWKAEHEHVCVWCVCGVARKSVL